MATVRKDASIAVAEYPDQLIREREDSYIGGTREGGLAAAATNKKKYGPEFYQRIGARGGKLGRTGGFACGEEGRRRARIAGAKGGRTSRKGPRTHCIHGHGLTPDNVYEYGHGASRTQTCRMCLLARQERRRLKERAERARLMKLARGGDAR